MSSAHNTGGVEVFLGIRTGNLPTQTYYTFDALLAAQKIFFLGTGREGPELSTRQELKPTFTDSTGTLTADDVLWCGEALTTTLVLTRWNEHVLWLASNLPYANGLFQPGQRPNPRQWRSIDVGRKLLAEGLALTLYLRYIRRAAPAMRAAGMPEGVRAPLNTFLVAPAVRRPGSRANSVGLIFQSLPRRIEGSLHNTVYRVSDNDISAVRDLNVENLSTN